MHDVRAFHDGLQLKNPANLCLSYMRPMLRQLVPRTLQASWRSRHSVVKKG
jgi:hypothetical protein